MIYPNAKVDLLPLDHSSELRLPIKLIVLHITSGPTSAGAIQTFKDSVSPNRVSAHFIIDRDGSIIQLVDTNRSAWHASQVNNYSIGIEHVAIPLGAFVMAKDSYGNMYKKSLPYMPAVDEQYASSSKLVAWLCKEFDLPCDVEHIQPHSKASPRDGHLQCCQGALDPIKVVGMASKLLM